MIFFLCIGDICYWDFPFFYVVLSFWKLGDMIFLFILSGTEVWKRNQNSYDFLIYFRAVDTFTSLKAHPKIEIVDSVVAMSRQCTLSRGPMPDLTLLQLRTLQVYKLWHLVSRSPGWRGEGLWCISGVHMHHR